MFCVRHVQFLFWGGGGEVEGGGIWSWWSLKPIVVSNYQVP